MTIKVESAKDSGRSFGEPKVTVYEVVVLADGVTQIVDCLTKRVFDFIGKDTPPGTTITPNKNPQYHPKLNIPKEGGDYKPIFGGKRPFTPSYKDSKEAVILSAKTMVLSYIKDLSIKNAEISGISITMESVKEAFSELIPVLELDKLPEAPIEPQASTRHPLAPIPHQLSEPKQAIIRIKMNVLNFRAKDLIDYAGACGIEIGYDPANDSALIGNLTDAMGEKLINALQDATR